MASRVRLACGRRKAALIRMLMLVHGAGQVECRALVQVRSSGPEAGRTPAMPENQYCPRGAMKLLASVFLAAGYSTTGGVCSVCSELLRIVMGSWALGQDRQVEQGTLGDLSDC